MPGYGGYPQQMPGYPPQMPIFRYGMPQPVRNASLVTECLSRAKDAGVRLRNPQQPMGYPGRMAAQPQQLTAANTKKKLSRFD